MGNRLVEPVFISTVFSAPAVCVWNTNEAGLTDHASVETRNVRPTSERPKSGLGDEAR